MRTHSLHQICSRATGIIWALSPVQACATAPVDRQAVDVTTHDESKLAGITKNENEKYDALASATPGKPDDSKAIGDANGASVDWILPAVTGLIASARGLRSGNVTRSLNMNASGACRPVSDQELR